YWHSGQPGQQYDGWRTRLATAGGGVVLMNSIHQIDVVRHVTGLSFTWASAATARLVAPVEVEDSAAAVLRLSNGALANLVASAHSPGAAHQERIEIDGALGRLDLPDPFGPQGLRLYLRQTWDRLPAGEWLDIEVPAVDSYLELTRTFI